ncbi:polyprenyl diphosphate synthase [Embleya scabrispora]|uniref:polyprenyl diphosphate synthase n=1 Tax=Embleya scabrispora TaxID=159449 RepID=UPI00035DA474|nr:polyprenyl diphosphate synthase [Embleya scabrispora]MYS86102.1 di-trans,poly-cis-decaprenylcistransferase [Streptomyces sp. SID5474]
MPRPRSVYRAAAIEDPRLVEAYEACRTEVRRAGGTEYRTARLMPPALRPALWAIYAAGRVMDDIADAGEPSGREALFDAWTTAFHEDLRRGDSTDPVRRALVHTMRTWDLPTDGLTAAFAATRADIDGRTHPTWKAWSAYSQAVNTSFFAQGAALLAAAGLYLPLRLRYLEAARQWVDALGIIDNLEDLAEDLAQGRITMPMEVLADHALTAADLVSAARSATRDGAPHDAPGAPVEALIGRLAAQARTWLAQPDLFRELPPALAVVARAVTDVGRLRLDRIERTGTKLLRRKPRLPRTATWRILLPAQVKAHVAWKFLTPIAPARSRHDGTTPRAPTLAGLLPTPRSDTPTPPRPHSSGTVPPTWPAHRLPRHVAVVMDGNGRWATDRGLPRTEGHRAGGKSMQDVVHGALEIGLRHLTLYAFSTENWRRRPEEIDGLLALVRDDMVEETVLDHDIRVRWAGSVEGLPQDILEKLVRLEHGTGERTGLTLTLCINYGGRIELAQAAASLARAAAAGGIDPAHISERVFAAHLALPDLPDVDLLWRTGGEQRTSNLLPWHAAYAELHFSDTRWPDVDRRDLWQAITTYTERARNFGAVPGPPVTAATIAQPAAPSSVHEPATPLPAPPRPAARRPACDADATDR